MDDKEFAILLARYTVTRKAIEDYCTENKLPRGTNGNIPCPICKIGIVRFSRAAYNGHIEAQCTTNDCVQWVE